MVSPESIGYFRVTNREFDSALEAIDSNPEEIINLPNDAVVAEIGSGLDQAFANGVKGLRPDIKVISIDPTLGLSKNNFFTTHKLGENGDLEQVSYTSHKNDYYKGEIPEYGDGEDTSKKIRNERAESAKETGNVVAGLAPEIPFAPNSIDMLIDTWGPGLYLDRYQQGSELEIYIQNIIRSLKEKGQARIYPIDSFREALEEIGVRNSNAKEEYKRILADFSGISYEFYDHNDPALAEQPDQTRVGVKIMKLQTE